MQRRSAVSSLREVAAPRQNALFRSLAPLHLTSQSVALLLTCGTEIHGPHMLVGRERFGCGTKREGNGRVEAHST
jgi:hypothetical protein